MTELADGYYAVTDPDDPATMTYWRVRNGRPTAWPPRTRYGPRFLRKDAPSRDDRDAYIAHVNECAIKRGAWVAALLAALDDDPLSARARFAALTTRCCVCGRALTDAATKVAGIGPECRVGIPADVLSAIATAVATSHAGAAS